jgi:virginiamycin B lyase
VVIEMAKPTNLIVLFVAQVLAASCVLAGEPSSPITEFELPESLSSSYAIAVDDRSHVWFTEKVGRNLATFDSSNNQFKVYPLPDSWGNVGPSQLTITKAGDIWFTIRRWADDVTETNVLGKFSPSSGTFIRYVISLDASPQEIVADDNGILWLLAADTNKLFRVDPVDAKILSYEIPTPNGNPQGLATGINDDIWFSEPNVNQIARYSQRTGFFEEYEIPTAFSNPGDIAVDSEGKVWFVERASNRLGLLYPDLNRFDEALVPTVNALPHAIEVDAQGRVWFLEYRGNKVGVFNPVLASFHEFAIPKYNSLPGELVFDAGKDLLWFTESNAESNQLGMLSIASASLPPVAESTPVDSPAAKVASNGVVAARRSGPDHTMLIIVLAMITVVVSAGIWVTVRPNEAA